MPDLRGALIGCGFFAVNQMHGWNDVQGAGIVAICDRDPERLKLVGDQFGIGRRYTDAGLMFADGGFDFVDIATTVNSHRALVEMAAAHKVPAICQKPFAPTLDDARAMVTACDAAGIPLMIHENFRWQTPIQAVRRVLDSGAIGTPFWGRFSFRSGYDVFSGQPYLAEGKRFIIEDLGIHTLDIARFLLSDVSSLSARTKRVNPRINGEDVATILLDHENGATSIVDVSYATKQSVEPFPETLIEIDGTEGSLRLSQGYELQVTNAGGTVNTAVAPTLLPWASRPWHNIQESVYAIQQHWADCLKAGAQTATAGADNLKTFALVEASYQSAASLETVKIGALLA
ncbi:Gfo/Idh/MocA family oxidoreductase [Pararhizobium antarcticum]|uniref:Oxidoreductase n=1 Tax=Pararhizobium antarcticum TaxID=1798805 RepID=A0A657LQX5_9HYPH|nr:Gfo/Idh/MocA family oxidoreductase [Pararhizobium antarcticum]OJF94400.1 oxidoreductase [Pararhizobium antarcticum]OJF95805.1 oxidoreductase [Rhizobium sp. 58]